MATEEVAALRERIANLEAAETAKLKSAAVARELGKYELASGAAAEQLQQLISPSISITKLSDGRDLLHDNRIAHLRRWSRKRSLAPTSLTT